MVIEIKGLPENQKIKHINVDISFDDSGEMKTIVKQEPCSIPVECPIPGVSFQEPTLDIPDDLKKAFGEKFGDGNDGIQKNPIYPNEDTFKVHPEPSYPNVDLPLKTTGVNEMMPVTSSTDERPQKEVPKEMLEMSF